MIRAVPPLIVLLALAGCARDTTSYPSLAQRPVEKLGFAEPDAPPSAPVVADPALDAVLATTTASLDRIAKGFGTDAARTEALARVARGRVVGSDPWLDAQSALAGLDDWRAQASALATDLDQAASERAAALAPDYPPLVALRARVQAEADREDETILRLQAMLPAA